MSTTSQIVYLKLGMYIMFGTLLLVLIVFTGTQKKNVIVNP